MAAPAIWWVRKDLRLGDNAALNEAARIGPVLPVFILDEVFEGYGACPLWRFGLGVGHLAKTLDDAGSRLVLRRGKAADVLSELCSETGARSVRWSRAYDPEQVTRDKGVKAKLEAQGIDGASVPGHVLFEPWTVETGEGGYYKVYSPFWRTVRDRDVGRLLPRPSLTAPESWPESESLESWNLARPMRRGAAVVEPHLTIGEERASSRLRAFVAHQIDDYNERRDFVAEDATSGLSENLAWGEISPRACWHAGMRALDDGKAGAETFLKELVWREFAYHLAWHTPRLVSDNWREGWSAFPWNEDEGRTEVKAWTQGRTGVPLVDAAMREMFVTGRMHNRARMIAASYVTKHLMSHWRIGQRWFEDCLADWDPASNALGWQWTAGSGPDAAPYFRVFNPDTQAKRFDPEGEYRARWIAEGRARPSNTALSYFDAIPQGWKMSPNDAYPEPVVALDEGRARALAAYENRDF